MSDDLHQTASGKRRDVISWDEFFMSVAIAAQRRSKDPNTQVGACIANTNHRGSLNDRAGATGYVTLFPCHDCAKILAQVGVGEVVYLDNKYADTDDGRISRRILDSCGISYRQVIVDVQIGTGGQAQQ